MNITVFLGSTFGSKKQYASDAERIGTWIGEHHHTLIYGGRQRWNHGDSFFSSERSRSVCDWHYAAVSGGPRCGK